MAKRSSRVADLIDPFLTEQIDLHQLTELSARNNRTALRRLEAVLGDRPVSSMTDDDVRQWLIRQKKLAQATRRSRFSMMRQFCRWLVRNGYLRRDPTVDVASPRNPRHVPRALTKEQVASLLLACPDARGRAIVVLMLELGLRCGEVSHLELGDWDRERATLRVVGKGKHERILPMTRAAEGAVRVYLSGDSVKAGPLFRSHRNHSRRLEPDSISRLVTRWMDEAGIKGAVRDGVSAHALRHTAASDVLDQCGDLRVVQEMLGHVHLATTSIYLRRAGVAELREAMENRGYQRVGSTRHDAPAPDEIDRLAARIDDGIEALAQVVHETRELVIREPDRAALSEDECVAWLETPIGRAYTRACSIAFKFDYTQRTAYWRSIDVDPNRPPLSKMLPPIDPPPMLQLVD